MTITTAAGAPLDEAGLNALTVAATPDPPLRRFTADVKQRFAFPGGRGERGERLLFRNGQVVPQTVIDVLFLDATIASVTPATGPVAGGTNVTIKGANFGGVSAVSFGGTAATLVAIVDETTLTCRTPAHAAGAVNVVVTDDSGAVTKTGGFTYA